MGLLDSFKKPDPQEIKNKLNEAIAASDAYANRGDRESALKVLLEYKDLGWGYPTYVYRIGAAYYGAKDNRNAKECFKRVMELNPNHGSSYILMGRVLFDEGDYSGAASSYERAIRLMEAEPDKYPKEDYPVACAWYGASLAMTGNKDEGEAYIRKAESKGYQKGNGLRQNVGLPVHTSCRENLVNKEVQEINAPDTPRMRELLQKMADLISEAIPDDWTVTYLYGEVLSDSRSSYFYFRRVYGNELVFCHDIPEKYSVDRGIYKKVMLEINGCLAELQSEYAENFEKAWTNLTFVLYRKGSFRIRYRYDDVLNSEYRSFDRQTIWKYETMAIKPETEEEKALIDKYLQTDRFMKM